MVFESAIHPLFEPARGSLSEPISIRNSRLIVRHLTGILTDSLKRIRARIGKPRFARSGSPFRGPAQSVFHRKKGGSK